MLSRRLGGQVAGFLGRNAAAVSIAIILTAGVAFRLTAYGDLRMSVATMDTESYMQSAQISGSTLAFTGERLLTTNLVYRVARADACPVSALSIPAIGKEMNRQLQACFAGLVLTQVMLSILGWTVLIWSFTALLSRTPSKIIAAVVLTAFAFAPQLGDWDSILSAESLTFSLFALAAGLGLSAFALARSRPDGLSKGALGLTIAALFVLAAWAFVRDSNVYTILILVLITASIACLPGTQRPLLLSTTGVLICVSAFALSTAYQSGRWKIPLNNAFEEYVLPIPARVALFEKQGMPAPDSATYQAWFDTRAPSAYMLFLARHPGFVVTTLLGRVNALFADNNQPYFRTPDLGLRNAALGFGDAVHPKSTAVVLIDVLLLSALVLGAFQSRDPRRTMWAAAAGWLLASAVLTLLLTFFADPIGVERHVVFALFLFRLLAWLATAVVIDVALKPAEPSGTP